MVADASGTVTMPPTVKLAAMASTQLAVHETWDTAGMRGTGSHDVSARDVLVGPDQLLSFTDRAWADDPIFRVPPFAILGPCLAAVPLGAGRAALDVAASAAVHDHEHPPVGRIRGSLGDDRALQQAFGQAEVALRAARALLLETLESQHHRALEGRPLRRSEVALLGLACTETMAAAEQAIDTAARQIGIGLGPARCSSSGGRDADTMRHHLGLRRRPCPRPAAGGHPDRGLPAPRRPRRLTSPSGRASDTAPPRRRPTGPPGRSTRSARREPAPVGTSAPSRPDVIGAARHRNPHDPPLDRRATSGQCPDDGRSRYRQPCQHRRLAAGPMRGAASR